MLHGYGKYLFANSGKIYRGEFENNFITGKGIMIFPDGSRYDGDFKESKMEGNGLMQMPNGDRYAG